MAFIAQPSRNPGSAITNFGVYCQECSVHLLATQFKQASLTELSLVPDYSKINSTINTLKLAP
jgi:hypothetical protein